MTDPFTRDYVRTEPFFTQPQRYVFVICGVITVWIFLVGAFVSWNVELISATQLEIAEKNKQAHVEFAKVFAKEFQ